MNKEKLKEIFSLGLVSGIGNETEGTCIEAAIALASGEGLTDQPSCVHEVDRTWSIKINDAPWSSREARAEALFPLALAQVGTAGKDRSKWLKRVILGTIQRIVPLALRSTAEMIPERRESLEAAALKCEESGDIVEAKAAAGAAGAAVDAPVDAPYAANVFAADAYAANAAYAAYAAAYDAACAANVFAAAYDAAYAAAYAACAANAAAYADAAKAAKAAAAADKVLLLAVEIALEAYDAND